MTSKVQSGFTIIEVSLFLAISGLLAAMLMTGWTAKINQERYRESVRSLQAIIQQQYNLAYNVQNGRVEQMGCADALDPNSGITDARARGQANCVLMGRYVTIDSSEASGTRVTAKAIIGSERPSAVLDELTATPEDIFKSYSVSVVQREMMLGDADMRVPWSPWLTGVGVSASDVPVMTFAVLRLPTTGAVYTYSDTRSVSLLPSAGVASDATNSLVHIAHRNSDTAVCVKAGAPFAGDSMKLIVRANASSQSAIEVAPGC